MTWHPAEDPKPDDARGCDAIETIIIPRARDLGSFEVRRALPSKERQMVGPFIFFDQMGPSEFILGQGMDVRPHPHIGLSTVTYLFNGEIMHRDSLGTELPIRPGELNWMTAGRGITHSERTGAEVRAKGSKLFGLQSWVALSAKDEENAPAFEHYDKADLPTLTGEGKTVRITAGSGAPLDAEHEERAIFTIYGEIEIAGDVFEPGRLLIFKPGDRITVRAKTAARFVILGGEPMDGPRHLWWNFVSSRPERIEQAKADWRQARFDTVPGDPEFIPLPDA